MCIILSLSRGGRASFAVAMSVVYVACLARKVSAKKLATIGLSIGGACLVLVRAVDTLRMTQVGNVFWGLAGLTVAVAYRPSRYVSGAGQERPAPDAVELALASAMTKPTEADRWDVVRRQLARKLEGRGVHWGSSKLRRGQTRRLSGRRECRPLRDDRTGA